LDIIGDIMLLGLPLKAHIVATRPGHAINSELTKKTRRKIRGAKEKLQEEGTPGHGASLGDVARYSPRARHPPASLSFVMIDRVVEFIGQESWLRSKNVTINEQYFQGHFPANP